MTTAAKHRRSWPYHTLFYIPVLSAEIDTRVHITVLHCYKWLYKQKTAAYVQHKMRLTGSRAYTRPAPVPKMPTGLIELMEDLTRDVLKNNPPDVYEFCADHMRKLLDIRDGPSVMRPLTLEEKIARAQEKVKKRGDARWQKYVKEKKTYYTTKTQSDPENIIYLAETKAKPPVYPDLNTEKASEIEISHEPGYVNDFPIEPNIKLSTNNTKVDDNKALTHDTKKDEEPDKSEILDNTHSSSNDTIAPNLTIIAQQFDVVTEIDSNNSVSIKNDHFNVSTEIKTDKENLQNSLPIEIIVNDTTVDAINEELSNAPNISNLKVEGHENIDGKTIFTHETSPTDKEIKKSEQETNNSLADLGKVVNTTLGILNIINESPGSPSQKEEIAQGNDNSYDKQQKQAETNVHEVVEKIDNKVISTQVTVSTNREVEKISEQATGYQANNSIADVGKVINTTTGILNIINENSRSPSLKVETLEVINDDINLDLLQSQDKNNFETDFDEVKEPIDKKIVLKSEEENEYKANNSSTDMGNIVNTALVILNINNDSPRSPIQKAETLEGINDNNNHDLLQLKDKKSSPAHVAQKHLSTETVISKVTDQSSFIEHPFHSDKNMHLGNDHSVCAMTDESLLKGHDVQVEKSVDDNTRNQDNMTKELKKDEEIIINESDSLKLTDAKKTSHNELEPTIDHEIDDMKKIKTDNITASGAISNHEPDIVGVLGSAEPLVNAVIIKTSHVQEEPNEGNIIEIRISQVAEALNNEVPLTINNINILEESDSPFDSPLHREKNEADIKDIEEANANQTPSVTGDIDCESNITSVNLDDVHNVNITSGLKSTSIDESTDGMDNTSLIESGTSDTTDDLFLNNANNSNMDLETAAVTIQKVFRSFMFKSRASTFDDNDENISLDEENEKKDEPEFQITNINKERRGISRMDTVLQTVNEEKSLSLSTDDSSTLSSAATTIQAHVRGFLVRNKLHSNKTASTNSLVNSDGHDDGDIDHKNNKTILNIHIVPEGGNYLSRDESMLTSMDLSLDGSPPSSLNLHPLGYDKNERRKQLKREDAIQSISPPSNNSGKLSEDVDSVKDMLITEADHQTDQKDDDIAKTDNINNRQGSVDTSATNSLTIETVIEAHKLLDQESSDADTEVPIKSVKGTLTKQSSDEMDVVTPFEEKSLLADATSTPKLMHSGEFHDVVLPTKVSRGDASVVSEFKNVLVYFLLWNNS